MEYNVKKREIKSGKVLSNLDKFVLRFIKILEKHVDYVIISGYVSILLGRTRTTEDVDVFIKEISFEEFLLLYSDLRREGFWCLNAEKPEEVFSYLNQKLAVRFAKENLSIPNFEVKFPKREIDKEVFNDFITIILSEGKLKLSSLERHIAFKNYYLGSDKDIEDAKHIEKLFEEDIDFEKINKLKGILRIVKKDED